MSRAFTLLSGAALALAALSGRAGAQQAKEQPGKKAPRPEVEVVFCLDTTGSMGGLIDAAKRKIWAICNQIAGGKPTPRLKVGLVAYRDRGDAYVTRVHDLTEDLDGVYANLMAFKAQGGGDFPESVNQALHESVTKVSWGKGKRTLRIIFLVGDAPPHMDYKDDVKYPETCQLAVKRDIIINTIQCGAHPETRKYWQDICRKAEGSYVQIDQGGGPVVAVETPFDKDLAKVNTELARSTLTYGHARFREKGEKRREATLALPTAPAAERASTAGRTSGAGGFSGSGGAYDLLDAVKDGKVKLKELKKDELPTEMQKLSPKEQEEHLKKVEKRRAELNTRAADLGKKRAEFIAKKLREDGKNPARDTFDGQVLQILQRQATRVNIRYEGTVEGKKK
jgi:Mg-chelatase subunit ChlD